LGGGGRWKAGCHSITPPPGFHGRSRCDRRFPQPLQGVTRRDFWTRPKLYQQYQSTTAAQWFSHFFEKPFVRRVKRRMPILKLKLDRSTIEVQIRSGSGSAVGDHPAFIRLPVKGSALVGALGAMVWGCGAGLRGAPRETWPSAVKFAYVPGSTDQPARRWHPGTTRRSAPAAGLDFQTARTPAQQTNTRWRFRD